MLQWQILYRLSHLSNLAHWFMWDLCKEHNTPFAMVNVWCNICCPSPSCTIYHQALEPIICHCPQTHSLSFYQPLCSGSIDCPVQAIYGKELIRGDRKEKTIGSLSPGLACTAVMLMGFSELLGLLQSCALLLLWPSLDVAIIFYSC